jgi:hypothetical protein
VPDLKEKEAAARSLGFALLDASRVYEDFLIPRREGRLRRRRVPPFRSATIGLVGRQRRFLRAAYTLADAGQTLEAIGPLRSMFEFLVCQRWLALDPDRNWKLWMQEDHAARDRLRGRLRHHAPALHDAAVAALTPEQRDEADVIVAARKKVADELGPRHRGGQRSLEDRAGAVGLGFLYDLIYRYESSAGTHPTLFAVDLLFERHAKGLRLRGEPTAQFAAPPVYLHGAYLLHEALTRSGEHTPELRLPELTALGNQLRTLAERHADARLPNWPELVPSHALD